MLKIIKSKKFRYIAGAITLFLLFYLLRGCCNTLLVANREVFISPLKTNTVIIEYDHVCRPYVYKKTIFGKRNIWTYPKSGFMETVSFDVEWLSENTIRLTYNDKNDEFDEEYIITIPE